MEDDDSVGSSHVPLEETGSIATLQYRRDELLGLQNACSHFQEEWWAQLLAELGSEVADELYEMQAVAETGHLRRRAKNSERRQRSKAKREALHAISVNALDAAGDGHLNESHDNGQGGVYVSNFQRVNENVGGRSYIANESWKHREFYKEEVESFQPPAFAVEGEPDFESGPPQDGWEYLRRVKYEAARCPKVVVAQIDPTKLVSEQTPYMPEIAEIPPCPPDLLPSKEWGKQFLEDFSELRMALSNIFVAPLSSSERLPSIRNKAAWEIRCFGSISSTPHEDPKEADTATTQTVTETNAESQEPQSSEAEDLSLASLILNESASASLTTESLDMTDEKDSPDPFIELLEHQLDCLLGPESIEASYVIDLHLLSPHVPVNRDLEGSFHGTQIDSEYLVSGEPASADHHSEASDLPCSLRRSEPEDNPVAVVECLDSHSSSMWELGHTELIDLSSGSKDGFEQLTSGDLEEAHRDKEAMEPSSACLSPVLLEGGPLTSAPFTNSVGAQVQELVHMELDKSTTGFEIQSGHLSTELHSVHYDKECLSSSYFDIVGLEDPLESGNLMYSLSASLPVLSHVDSADSCLTIENQFEYLTICEPEIVVQSFSDPEPLSQLDGLFDPGYTESNSVIDPNLFSFHAPANGDLGESFNGTQIESEYLTCREPLQIENDSEMKDPSSCAGTPEPKSDPLNISVPLDSHRSNDQESGHTEVDNSSSEMKTWFEHTTNGDPQEAYGDKEGMGSSLSYFDLLELEDGQLGSADLMDSYNVNTQFLSHVELESCGTIENQFDYLTIGEPESMLSSFGYPDPPEFEDVKLITTDSMDSFGGFEIYGSGNILLDESDCEKLSGIDESHEEVFAKVFQLGGVSKLPFIHLLLRLDEVSRAALFRYHVSWLENVDGLPQDRALWLLALSAVVDTPLNAETSAAFRAMLRYCAGIRALKQARDDEDIYMLNVLITVAGLYYGQAEVNMA